MFQRDRDRIVHAKAFRRLKHKTQVFIAPEGDHYRVRLTHTLEVSQIARTVARALRLNEDLTEAIALGHDLGHTPFGHLGEQALTPFLGRPFRHNEQCLRVVEHLENDGAGLNLTWEVRDGILHHPGRCRALHARGAGGPVRRPHRLRQPRRRRRRSGRGARCRRAPARGARRPRADPRRPDRHARRPTWSRRAPIADEIALSEAVFAALDALRDFMFERVYLRDEAQAEHEKAMRLIRTLFAYYLDHPDEVPPEYHRGPGGPADPRRRLHRGHDRPVRPPDVRAALPSPGLAAGGSPGGGGWKDPAGGHRGGPERTDIVKLVSQLPHAQEGRARLVQWPVPVPPREDAVVLGSPSSRVYYCFGCGAGGDAIKFLRELEHLDFVEAVERLAATAGVTLPYEGDSPAAERRAASRKALHRANEDAAGLYHRMLLEGREAEQARAYLAERGITADASSVRDRLRPRRIRTSSCGGCRQVLSSEILVEAGLAIRRRRRTVRDRFRGG